MGNCRTVRSRKSVQKCLEIDGVGRDHPLIDSPEHRRAIPGSELRRIDIRLHLASGLSLLDPLLNVTAINHMVSSKAGADIRFTPQGLVPQEYTLP